MRKSTEVNGYIEAKGDLGNPGQTSRQALSQAKH